MYSAFGAIVLPDTPSVDAPIIAASLSVYNGVGTTTQSPAALMRLTTMLAPLFGVVVLNQTEPVGRGFAPVVLNPGTCVCLAWCSAGALYVILAVSPRAVSSAASDPLPMVTFTEL